MWREQKQKGKGRGRQRHKKTAASGGMDAAVSSYPRGNAGRGRAKRLLCLGVALGEFISGELFAVGRECRKLADFACSRGADDGWAAG